MNDLEILKKEPSSLNMFFKHKPIKLAELKHPINPKVVAANPNELPTYPEADRVVHASALGGCMI